MGLLSPRRAYSVRHVTCEQFLLERGISLGGHWTLPTAADNPQISIATIQRAVAEHFRIRLEEMTSARRSKDVARPRQVAMYLCTLLTPRSLPEIGRRFARDHTTVIHGIRQIEKLRQEQPELDRDINALSIELSRSKPPAPPVFSPGGFCREGPRACRGESGQIMVRPMQPPRRDDGTLFGPVLQAARRRVGGAVIDPAILRALQAAGCTTDQIIAAVEADCALDAERKEKKRAGNRERQRRFREARNAGNALQGVTERDSALPPPPPDKSPPDPQKLTPTPAPTGSSSRARKADLFPCPEGVDPKAWDGLIANRKAKRAALSEGAHNQILVKLHRWAEDGWPPGPIVAHAAEMGWTTVFPTDEMKAPRNGRPRRPMERDQPDDGLGPTARSAIAAFPDVFGSRAGHAGGAGH